MVFVHEVSRLRSLCPTIVWHHLSQWQWVRYKETMWTLRCVFSQSQSIYHIYFESALFLEVIFKVKEKERLALVRLIHPFNTAQKMKFSIKDFFSKCDQTRSLLRIWAHILKKSLMENFIFLCSANFNWVC